MKIKLSLLIGLLFSMMACAQTMQDKRADPPEKQGYSKEKSTQILDAEVRNFLDGMLKAYYEPGLFVHRPRLLAAIGILQTHRLTGEENSTPNERRFYVDKFAAQGLFSRQGWKGEYAYTPANRSPGSRKDMWHSAVRVNLDQSASCIDSRAVEGYLDLVLKQSPFGLSHPRVLSPYWHEGAYASLSAETISKSTPALGLRIGDGCLLGVSIGNSFNVKEIPDEYVRR
jgi:hypothetical protein